MAARILAPPSRVGGPKQRRSTVRRSPASVASSFEVLGQAAVAAPGVSRAGG
ncbi:MAG: hypothetical protein MUF34_14385 [Polyangiaceae bacterium]|nr:hypothetical protein [Polyangiaceae bacterium]